MPTMSEYYRDAADRLMVGIVNGIYYSQDVKDTIRRIAALYRSLAEDFEAREKLRQSSKALQQQETP